MQDWFTVRKSINVVHHMNKSSKQKYHMIASMYTERTHNNIQHQFFIFKNSSVNQEYAFATWKRCTNKILKKSMVQIVKHLRHFFKISNKTCSTSQILSNINLEVLSNIMTQIKIDATVGKGIKIFSDGFIFYTEIPEESADTSRLVRKLYKFSIYSRYN